MGNQAVTNLLDALNAKEQWATTLVLRYALPPTRTVELDDAEPETIKQALIDGDISTNEAKEIATVIEKLKSVANIDDLRNRLAELEAMVAQR